jgi:hypothetical protein
MTWRRSAPIIEMKVALEKSAKERSLPANWTKNALFEDTPNEGLSCRDAQH